VKRLMVNHPLAGAEAVIFTVHRGNRHSRRAVEKIGARLDREDGEHVAYRLANPL
jgi:hypothetical protein